MKKRHVLFIIVLFLLVLSSSRFIWMDMFRDVSHIHIKNGKLDLLDWDAQDEDVVLLDGEWEFFPSQWLIKDGKPSSIDENQKKLVQVPGRWNEDFEDGGSTPFGYGSYRLRVHVNEEEQGNYSLFIPSVRSASELYVNGKLLAGSGQIGTSKETYHAKNLPYTTFFTADENGVIEIVVQAANFQDIRRSGIIRSIKFGSEAAITKERNMSLSMQVLASVLFLMHSIYALVLFILGKRDKKLLYFSLLLFSVTCMNLISNDEKIFHLLFNVSYTWDFRLANVFIPIACYALVRCLDYRMIPYWRKINPIFLIMSIGVTMITLFLSPNQIIMFFPVYGLLAGIALMLSIIVIVRKLYHDVAGNLLLLLSLLAMIHHFIWVLYWRESGVSVIHYPFDLIIAVGSFASIWFKDYFAMHTKTEKLAAELQKTNEYKDQFLANTSHEFKNPLHGMINMSESVLIREKEMIANKSIHELETIVSVGQRMSLLLNDLLDDASLRKGKPRLKKENIKVSPIVNGVVDMLQFTVNVKPVKIMNHVPENFPLVDADENRIIQIVYNLLHNAIKYTDEGEIRIQAEVKDNHAWISIVDTGRGIDEAFQQRMFSPYEQVSYETMGDSGLGLGLSISKQLIELHGGALTVASTLGIGSTFAFSLPLASTIDEEEVNVASVEVYDKTTGMQNNYLLDESIDLAEVEMATTKTETDVTESERVPILIVDDDPINLQVLDSILSVDQYEVTTVLSGKEALQKLDEKEWHLVISDIMMPGMSGYELTEKIRRRYSFTELPILLITARSNPKDIQAGFLAGANDYVTKPVERLEFLSRVRVLTALKTAVREQLHLEAVWLQAQIQPHFLFNTLNSIIALSDIDLEKMNDLLIELSEFLRSKFRYQYIDELIPIEEELKIVQSYVNIEQVRFGNRLQVVWETSIDKGVKVPFLSIQPLVENAINHGVMERIRGGKVVISTYSEGDHVIVSIEDDGVGMDEMQLQSLLEREPGRRISIGLINTNQRLMRSFRTGLQIKSKPNKGTVVYFVVPKLDSVDRE